jgi:hypothetical protein
MQALVEASRLLDHGHRSSLVDDLVAFAHQTDSDITWTRSCRHVDRRRGSSMATTLSTVAGALPRLRRRIRENARVRRWHRTGVYEPLMIIDLLDPTPRSEPTPTRPKVPTS